MSDSEIPLALVVAVARNGAIGIDGGLPWRLPGDLAFFKRVTMGKPILMGRKTWQSLPRRPLPGRANLVISRDPDFAEEGAECFIDLASAIRQGRQLAEASGADEICIIGGAEIYRQALPQATRLYLTEVAADPVADTYFPQLDRSDWVEEWREAGPPGANPDVPAPDYDFVLLTRRLRTAAS